MLCPALHMVVLVRQQSRASFSSSPLPLRSEQAVLHLYFASIPFSELQCSKLTFFTRKHSGPSCLQNATDRGVAFSLEYRSWHILCLRLTLCLTNVLCFNCVVPALLSKSCSPHVACIDYKICSSVMFYFEK